MENKKVTSKKQDKKPVKKAEKVVETKTTKNVAKKAAAKPVSKTKATVKQTAKPKTTAAKKTAAKPVSKAKPAAKQTAKKSTKTVTAKKTTKKTAKKTEDKKQKLVVFPHLHALIEKVAQKKAGDGRIKLVIDSDVANEIDDQFAIAYAFARRDVFDIKAITLAPFKVVWQKNLSIREGMIDSKNEAERILRLFGVKWTTKKPFVHFGCEGFLSDGYDKRNPAVDEIVRLAKENDALYICCIGTLTNVAMALRVAPKIAKKLHVIWLGTDNVMLDHFEDNNYSKDVLAFNEVIASEVDLTIFPTYLAKSFVTSTYEFEKNIKRNSITQYLSSIMNKFQFTEVNMGIKTIYDIGPVAYLLNKKEFTVKTMSPSVLLKDGHVSYPKDRKIDYITSVPKHSFVWTDFLNAINSCEEKFLKPQIFFTSDTHFNQDEKIKKHQTPFGTVEQMNAELVRRWNSKVGPNDIVYHLGDFGDYDFVRRLNGKIILICGKHEDSDSKKDFDAFRNRLIDLGFKDVIKDGMFLDESVLGEKVYLTHKPGNRAKDCKTIFGNLKDLSLVEKFGFNVCVTYHYFAPVSVETAKRYLKLVSESEKE